MEFAVELENMLRTTFSALPALLLAGLGGMITAKVGLLNLGLEGMMLMSAFMAVVANFYTGSAFLGLFSAVIFGTLVGFLFAVFNIKLKVNNIIVSVGINMLAVALTRFLLVAMFHQSGAFSSEKIVKMPTIPLPFFRDIPILKTLDGLSCIFWLGIAATLVLGFIMKRTALGLRIRATGLNDTAVNTAGVSSDRIRYLCISLSGTLCGIGGAYLSTSYLAMFTDNMTAGRGFLGNIASIMGGRTAGGTFLGSLLFGATDGFTMKIQTMGFPSQLIQLIPYVVAFLVVILSAVIARRRKKIVPKPH